MAQGLEPPPPPPLLPTASVLPQEVTGLPRMGNGMCVAGCLLMFLAACSFVAVATGQAPGGPEGPIAGVLGFVLWRFGVGLLK